MHPFDPSFRPDYNVALKDATNPQADYVVDAGQSQQNAWNFLPNYYDWVAWYNEMLSLMYQERL